MPQKNKIYFNLFTVGILFIVSEVVWIGWKHPDFLNQIGFNNKISAAVGSATSTVKILLSEFDGTVVSSTAEQIPEVLGIMIDNHPDARPEAGLSQARIVYEAPVEGGLTRYFALFNSKQSVAKVGPIRSARPYFLDWLAEYGNSSYWHCGGSSDALALIKQNSVWDVNQFYFDPYFWRSSDRTAPHNLYTSSEKWNTLIVGTPHTPSEWSGWNYNLVIPQIVSSSEVMNIKIKLYGVAWTYDTDDKRYLRYLSNKPEYDEADQKIFADNVIVQLVDTEVIDEEGRRSMTTVGEGEARFLRDGRMVRATWKKEGRTFRTRFYDFDGNELSFKPGQTWIEVVPIGTSLDVSS